MQSLFLFALAQSATPTPRPLTTDEDREIACIALLGLLAHEQQGIGRREPAVDDAAFPDVTRTGKTYAGIVGARISANSGLPREVIAQAIMAAAGDARAKSNATIAGKADVRNQVRQCIPLMQAELAAAEAANMPLPKPVKTK